MKYKQTVMNNKGLTLIEILLVVVILVSLASMVIPRLTGRSEQAKIAVARVDIYSNISSALKLYELDNGMYPSSRQGLKALRVKPASAPIPTNWNGPYLEKKPVDPWGREYQYSSPGSHGLAYDLWSYGPREDDEENRIANWE